MQTVINANKLTKKFGSFTAVDAITFEVKQGEIFGFLGANGAGKTTAIRMLCGLSVPTDGKAEVAGINVKKDPEAVKRQIGYMSQKFSLYEDLTIRENFRFYGGVFGIPRLEVKKRFDEMMTFLDLQTEADALVSSIPLGWKQKLAFSLAMFHHPKIIFLDEPTGGVDPITRRVFWDSIYEAAHNGITIFVTTHYMDEAEYCDRISMMVDGKIKAMDTPSALKKQFHCDDMDGVFQKLARGTSN